MELRFDYLKLCKSTGTVGSFHDYPSKIPICVTLHCFKQTRIFSLCNLLSLHPPPPLIIFKETYLWIYIKGQTVSQKVRHTWQSSGMVPCEFAYVIWGYVTWHPVINNLQSTSGCQLIGHHWRSSAEVLMIWCTAYYSRHTNHQFSLITPSVRTSLILKLFYHHFVKANSRLSTNKKTFVN